MLHPPQTGKCKIAQDRATAVLPGDDMLDFEGDRLCKELSRVVLLRKQAVFASVPRSLAHGLCQLIHA